MVDADPPQAHPETQTPLDTLESRIDTLFGNYKGFSENVDAIMAVAAAHGAATPAYVGEGLHCQVYRFEQSRQMYTARIVKSRSPGDIAEIVTGHLRSSAVCEGRLPMMQRTFAGSYQPGVVVSEYIEGETLRGISKQTAESVTDEQMAELARTIVRARAHGIMPDALPVNLLYTDTGFRVIDYDHDEDLHRISPTDAFADLTRFLDVAQLDDDQVRADVRGCGGLAERCQTTIILMDKLATAIAELDRISKGELKEGLSLIARTKAQNEKWLEKHVLPPEPSRPRGIGTKVLGLFRS
jgi:hypothetical protein